ncbi:unnamed protein product [Nesidiocoris tenuis]|uniref:Lipase n=1 Tax=Nesidiocoris tenuis TaxID=355587 RepID=A0A6H5I042_9HEMI|nr:unnamed protein product [Nesidiocoris tenuis]
MGKFEHLNALVGAIPIRDPIRLILLDAVDEIKKRGYGCELHHVTTEDGYALTMHRVTSRGSDGESRKRTPVMVQHGLSCASTDWVVMDEGLVYRLVDKGCDVWLGNTRGNVYSRSHVHMSPKDPEFWNFSWHEMGQYDLPSMIDHILESTGHKRLTYVGHSQGSTAFFVMASIRPAFNAKVKAMFALGPVASLGHLGSVVLKQLALRSDAIYKAANVAGISHVTVETSDFVSKIVNMFQARVFDDNMTYVLSSLWGYPCPVLRSKLFHLWLGHARNGLSLKTLAHYAQSACQRYWFNLYDHGDRAKNLEQYGAETPPAYPLKNITVPVTLLYGQADWLAHPLDVRALYDSLTNAERKQLVQMPLCDYNHLDFCWSHECQDDIVKMILDSV